MTTLSLAIDGTPYTLHREPGDGWTLSKRSEGRESYHVHLNRVTGRVECSCGDFEHRRAQQLGGVCKHARAALAVGLL